MDRFESREEALEVMEQLGYEAKGYNGSICFEIDHEIYSLEKDEDDFYLEEVDGVIGSPDSELNEVSEALEEDSDDFISGDEIDFSEGTSEYKPGGDSLTPERK